MKKWVQFRRWSTRELPIKDLFKKEKKMVTARIAVPTATVIGYHSENPFRVALLRPVNKHGGRLVLVGGRLNLNEQESFEETAIREWSEEVGGKGATLSNVALWAVKTDPWADVRQSTFGKLTHDGCLSENSTIQVTGHYGCPDLIFTGKVEGEPFPSDGEAKECVWFDIRTLKITESPEKSQFGAQHDLVLRLYADYLDGGFSSSSWLADMATLRKFLREKQ